MDTDSDNEPMFPYNSENDLSSTIFNYENEILTSPLLRAIFRSDNDYVESQIQSGKDLNIPNNYGNTPLHAAAIQKSTETLNLLLQLPDMNLNCINFMGDTPFLLSIRLEQPDAFVMNFLEAGCDINIANNEDETPLHLAVARSSICIALELIKRGADINALDGDKYTPLRHAVEAGNLELVCMLLDYNADVSIACYHNLTPFMYAVNDTDKLEIAKVLFNYYADFTCITTDGYSALLLAANSVSPIAIDIVNAGADVNCITPDDDSVLLFALHYDNSELFKAVWPKFNQQNLLYTDVPFLFEFINTCRYPRCEWVECMYEILNSPFVAELVVHCINYVKPYWGKSLFNNLITTMFILKVELSDRLAIIQIFLSFGAIVSINDINLVNALYGCNQELDIIIQCGNSCEPGFRFRVSYYYFLLPTFIFACEKDYSSEYILELLEYQVFQSHTLLKLRDRIKEIIKPLGFFSFPYKIKQALRGSYTLPTQFKDAILTKLNAVPEFPSLVELSRNEIRKSIKRNKKITFTYQFHNAVNNFNIPPLIKNIILFKMPIYG